ncbi:MAG: phosphatase PAP2 family protein [Thermoleophilaceae bacterium]|nr:phosphatase PAP2 family protein [Thermoleophilaceae bacterium]
MNESETIPYPGTESENAPRPETLEEEAGRRLLVSFDRLTRLDLALLRILRTRGHARPLEVVVLRYTRWGEHAALWHAVAALGVLLDRRLRTTYLRATVVIALTQAANFVAKTLISRARPLLEDLPPLSPTISGLSTPSAHASTSAAAASVLSDTLPRLPVYFAAAVMALSRPYLGVHYPSDTAAGVALGLLVARAVRRGHLRLERR